jgi:predicted Zn finger-like uncharacterized protein
VLRPKARSLSLLTRCPRCKTLFRVLPEQLQAKGGQVRCGRCLHTFDGFEALAPERSPGSLNALTDRSAVTPEGQAARALSDSPAARTRSGRDDSTNRLEPRADVTREWTAADPLAVDTGRGRRPARQGTMIVACVLLIALFLGQLTYILRGELAARYPAMRSVLASACGAIGCAVALPQRPDLVKIEASDLNMVEAGRPALVQLTATLRSYADHDLAYPALDLVLTNATEHALARRIFAPEEYLHRSRDPRAGIPARGEITIALDLDTDDLKAAGFRLDLLPVR